MTHTALTFAKCGDCAARSARALTLAPALVAVYGAEGAPVMVEAMLVALALLGQPEPGPQTLSLAVRHIAGVGRALSWQVEASRQDRLNPVPLAHVRDSDRLRPP